MRPAFGFAILAASMLLTASCGVDEPVAPNGGATVNTKPEDNPWVHDVFHQDVVQYAECLGENLHFLGEFEFAYRENTTGSGNYAFLWRVPPTDPNSPLFGAYGMTSGKAFLIKNGSNLMQMIHLAGENQAVSIVDREVYLAEDGSGLLVTYSLHVAMDANGVLRVNNEGPFTIECLNR